MFQVLSQRLERRVVPMGLEDVWELDAMHETFVFEDVPTDRFLQFASKHTNLIHRQTAG